MKHILDIRQFNILFIIKNHSPEKIILFNHYMTPSTRYMPSQMKILKLREVEFPKSVHIVPRGNKI